MAVNGGKHADVASAFGIRGEEDDEEKVAMVVRGLKGMYSFLWKVALGKKEDEVVNIRDDVCRAVAVSLVHPSKTVKVFLPMGRTPKNLFI